MNISSLLARALQPIADRVRMMLARAVVKLVNDGTGIQEVQVSLLAGEIKDGVEHMQPYGYTSNPHPGSEATIAFINGNRDHGIAIVIDDRRYRLKPLATGEVALYTDENQSGGHRVILRRGRLVEIDCDTLRIAADTQIDLNVGNNANRLVMTSAGTDWKMADYEAHQ